jgi:hypothetical protein
MATMSTYDDRAAGLRLVLPPGWQLRTDDLMGPFTCMALRADPASDRDDPAVRRALDEERQLWAEASGRPWADEAYNHDPASTTFVLVGTLDRVEDGVGAGDLVEAADWVATTFGVYFDAFPERSLDPEEETRQAFELGGRPAASVSFTFSARRHGDDAGHLCAVAVELADGRVSFGLGLAKADTDWPVIDQALEGLRPLA